jgi:hypothetical protein
MSRQVVNTFKTGAAVVSIDLRVGVDQTKMSLAWHNWLIVIADATRCREYLS